MSLTDTQAILLSAASQREDQLVPTDDRLKGGAIGKVANGLLAKGLVTEIAVSHDQPIWRTDDAGEYWGLRITACGLRAIGIDDDVASLPEEQAAPDQGESTRTPVKPGKINVNNSRIRAGSKQSQLITMLEREQGASIAEMASTLGWLPHTTRAALTGLRQKGYELEREITGGERGSVYRVMAMPIATPATEIAVATVAV